MKMTTRNVLLAAIAGLLAVPTWLELRSDRETFVDLRAAPRMFAGFTEDNVGVVVLKTPKPEQPDGVPGKPAAVLYDQLLLQRVDDAWRIGQPPNAPVEPLAGAPALQSQVELQVFQQLVQIRKDRETLVLADASDEQLAEYGLDEAHAMLVQVADKQGKHFVAELFVGAAAGAGRTGTDGVRGTYVRQKGSADVVLYEWTRPWKLSVDANQWLDRVLLRVDPDKVRAIAIRNTATGRKWFRFERGPQRASFVLVDGGDDLGAVRQAEVEGLVQRFRAFGVQSYARPLSRAGNMAELGLQRDVPVEIELEIAGPSGSDTTSWRLAIGNHVEDETENAYYATCSGSPFLLKLPSSAVHPFELDVARRLFDPKPDGK